MIPKRAHRLLVGKSVSTGCCSRSSVALTMFVTASSAACSPTRRRGSRRASEYFYSAPSSSSPDSSASPPRYSFVESWLTDELVNVGTAVTDEEWPELKPRVVKVLNSVRKRRQSLELKSQQAARRDALKPYYEQLRQDQLSPAARTFFPLFADFLLFDSTRSLWEPKDAVVNESAYNAGRDAMEDEINGWRVDVRFYALQQILGCTLDIPHDEELSSDQDAYDAYDDGFFDLLTSALVCAIKPCACSAQNRPTFFGSLPDLLDHQHEIHGELKPSMTELYSKKASAKQPKFRFSLPLEVANAVVALCELCELDEETATPGDVDEFFEDDETARLQWYNAPRETHKKKERDWRVVGRSRTCLALGTLT